MEIPYVALTGGEPFLHSLFFEICEMLRDGGVEVKVETNGSIITEREAQRIVDLDLRSVQVSLDGASPETYGRMREGGDWKKAVRACELLEEKGANVEIVFVPTSFNVHEIEDVVDLAASLGASHFYTGKIMRIGRAAENWPELVPTEDDYEKFFDKLEKKAREYDGELEIFYYPHEVVNELNFRIDHPAASLLVSPNGKVKLTGPLPFVCGDLKKHRLKEVWKRFKAAWNRPEIREFAKKATEDHSLLAKSNDLVEIF